MEQTVDRPMKTDGDYAAALDRTIEEIKRLTLDIAERDKRMQRLSSENEAKLAQIKVA